MTREAIALDRIASVRWEDEDGRLHVDRSHFSRVQVATYRGHEITGWQENHLDPNKVYYAYRPAEELQKPETVRSIIGIPIQYGHHIDTPDSPADETRIGTTGDQAFFEAPYLTGSLHIYDANAIRKIKEGSKKELSLAYYYTPDFTSGVTEDGEHYDFIMRNIRATHLALVEEGRAGTDCCVMDSSFNGGKAMDDETKSPQSATESNGTEEKEVQIAKVVEQAGQALQDLHKTNDKGEVVDQDDKNVATDSDKEAVAQELRKKLEALGIEGDALADVNSLIDSLAQDDDTAEDEDNGDEAIIAKLKELGIENPTAECVTAFKAGAESASQPTAQDEETVEGDESSEDAPAEDEDDEEASGEKPKFLSQDQAMKVFGQMQDALEDVRPVTGKLRASAFDSAGSVYLHALKQMGVQIGGVTKQNARAVFEAYRKGADKGAKVSTRKSMASDSAMKSSLLDTIGSNIRII